MSASSMDLPIFFPPSIQQLFFKRNRIIIIVVVKRLWSVKNGEEKEGNETLCARVSQVFLLFSLFFVVFF